MTPSVALLRSSPSHPFITSVEHSTNKPTKYSGPGRRASDASSSSDAALALAAANVNQGVVRAATAARSADGRHRRSASLSHPPTSGRRLPAFETPSHRLERERGPNGGGGGGGFLESVREFFGSGGGGGARGMVQEDRRWDRERELRRKSNWKAERPPPEGFPQAWGGRRALAPAPAAGGGGAMGWMPGPPGVSGKNKLEG